ncbi:sigma factor-like helix-turn-helix DNA-binding protein [Kineococcus sp. SYSU DK005]|uniref:sigma factor-like helix-turn-helix DNA-binding protein n=1 Tax=Kineococcus sp. SYSU DK005 TaxID=3383126 RepID=UPI003D7C367A
MSLDFDQFVAVHGPALQRLAGVLLLDPAAVPDVVEDVLALALLRWRRIQSVDDPVVHVDRMLVVASTSTWRRVLDRKKLRRAWRSRSAGTGEDLQDSAGGSTVEEVLRSLTIRQRAVIALHHLEHMSHERIAEVLEVSVNTVRAESRLGLAALRAAQSHPAAP